MAHFRTQVLEFARNVESFIHLTSIHSELLLNIIYTDASKDEDP